LSRERLPVIGRAERVAKPFVIVVTSLAALCMLIWLHQGWELALDHTTALLIVACPCALALATPLVTAVAIGDAAKRGRLIKGADVFDRMRLCNRVFLDKTGTVTRGRFAVQSIAGDESLIPLAAAIERETPHPIASAIAELSADETTSETTVAIGKGVEGMVDGVRVAVGQRAFVESVTGASCEHLVDQAVAATELGNTAVFAADSTGRVCVIALGDEIRDDARALVANLHARGKRVSILSGDDPTTVRLIAAQLGLDEADALGGMSPTTSSPRSSRRSKRARSRWRATASTTRPRWPRRPAASRYTAGPRPRSPPPTSTSPPTTSTRSCNWPTARAGSSRP
ncbi:MAG: HAD-IC family P-type ATPase, partial [Planctomycetota bacterium]